MIFIIALVVIVLMLFVYSITVLSKREDEWMERQYHEYIKSKNKDNNNQNNEGE